MRVDVANVAWPPANSTVPNLVEPSKNVTLPVVGEPGPTTVKVKTTASPGWDGFAEEVNVAPPSVPESPPPAVTVLGTVATPVVGVDPAVVGVGVELVVVGPLVVGVAPVVEVEAPVVEVVAAPGGKQAPFARTIVVPTQLNVLVTVAVQVRVLAPVVADPLHWSIVTRGAESDATPAVAVQVTVPVAPESLHWPIAWYPPISFGPAGVAVQVIVEPLAGLHWLMVDPAGLLAGAPVIAFVIVAVQVTVAAPPIPAWLHWCISVMGEVDVVVLVTPSTVVTIVDAVVDVPSAL